MRTPQVKVKVILPKKLLKIDDFRLGMLNALHRIERLMKREYKRTYSTWKNKPVFKTTISLKGGQASIDYWTDNEIMGYLNWGTKIRHALMSNPFIAKTTPNHLTSRAGMGGLVVVSKKINRPGIKPRRWDRLVKKSLERHVPQEFQKGIDYAIKRSGLSM